MGRYSKSVVYTFGDNRDASRRLHRLAEVYEQETRDLLSAVHSEFGGRRFDFALDLGCGPGWSTRLIEATLSPRRTVGLDASEAFLAEARINQPQLEFIQHDVLMTPFPVGYADFIFCRFLLTHLPSPHAALESWAHAARSGALLAIHETEALHSTHPAFVRYYEMVARMQKHYGHDLNVGAALTDAFRGTSWNLVSSDSVVLEKSARDMAQLHLANLRTWGRNDFAVQAFDRQEMDQLASQLDSIASGSIDAGCGLQHSQTHSGPAELIVITSPPRTRQEKESAVRRFKGTQWAQSVVVGCPNRPELPPSNHGKACTK